MENKQMIVVEQRIVGHMGVCCYVVGCPDSKRCAVIDPGGDEQVILDLVKELAMTVELIINTHGHADHVCGNGPVQQATGAPIAMHGDDIDFFARPEVVRYFASLGLPPSPPPDRRLTDNETIAIGSLTLQVIHTPGHTPGGICLYTEPHLFTGDTLFVGGVGRTDFPGGDTATLLRAIKGRLYALPESTVVWPGHGYGGLRSTLGQEKRTNPFLQADFS